MWIEREKRVLVQLYRRSKIVIDKGSGCYVYDVDGNRYLDFVAGIACANIGHCHPKFVERVSEQLGKLIHVSNLYYTTPQIELAEKLREITGFDRFFFCNSGAEAVEAALKFARKATGRKKFVAFSGAFHGRTMGALSVTHKERFRTPFEPLVQPVSFARFNDPEDLKAKVDRSTAAVILEPVQGEAGVYPAEKEFIKTIFDLREELGYLVIFDEVQTGFGRTGRWFAKEHFGVQPDIMAMAKAMGSGIPIGCAAVSEDVAAKLEPGDHASTFGGNPLSCVAAMATIEIIEEERLVENSARMGEYLKKKLKAKFSDVRGLGLMVGLGVADATKVVDDCLRKGLLVNATSDSNIRLVPPLIVGKDEIDFAVSVIESVT